MTGVVPVATPAPPWLAAAVPRLAQNLVTAGRVPAAPDAGAREAAVLVLLSGLGPAEGAALPGVPDVRDSGVVLIRRSSGLRSHAGQVAFPGGRTEPGDADPVATALREATEEVGLVPGGVEVVAPLPSLHVVHSNHAVTPVLAWWRHPSPVRADGAEAEAVAVVPLGVLADPRNRLGMARAGTGTVWPVFQVPDGFLVWGFTGWIVDRLLEALGLDTAWDRSRTVTLEALLGGGPVT